MRLCQKAGSAPRDPRTSASPVVARHSQRGPAGRLRDSPLVCSVVPVHHFEQAQPKTTGRPSAAIRPPHGDSECATAT